MFNPHFGGVIAKGMLLPLSDRVLPPGVVVLRMSQVKAPEAKTFWDRWSIYWQQLLVWAHQVHHQQQQQQQNVQLQQQQQYGAMNGQPCSSSSSSGGSTCAAGAATAAATAAATVAAAVAAANIEGLSCVHPQDRPWFQQLCYICGAQQLLGSSSSSSRYAQPPPLPCQNEQQQQLCRQGCHAHSTSAAEAAAAAAAPPGSHALVSGGSSCGDCSTGSCSCEAMLEVVRRPVDGAEKHTEHRIGKNLLTLLHHAGVPQDVFAE